MASMKSSSIKVALARSAIRPNKPSANRSAVGIARLSWLSHVIRNAFGWPRRFPRPFVLSLLLAQVKMEARFKSAIS